MRAWLLAALLVPGASAQALLVGLVPDLPGSHGREDAFAVGALAAVDLGGFSATDGEDTVLFPSLALAPQEVVWFVGNATAWDAHQGPRPRIELPRTLRLGNDGDDVALLDAAGAPVDFVAFGDRDASGLLPGATPGLMLVRDRTGGAWVDTDSAVDWLTPRRHKVGESGLAPASWDVDAVTMYASPDSSFGVLTGLIAQASERLHLHVYELRSAELTDALVAAKGRNPALDLQVLVDGNPVGMTGDERHAAAHALLRLQEAGGHVVLAGNGRYDDHHLKVLVADAAVAVQSENWVPSGVPADPTWGNRGWGAVLHDTEAADWFAHWMAADRHAWDATAFDVADFDPAYEEPPRRFARSGAYQPTPAVRIPGPVRVDALVAPEHTQDPRTDSVATLLDGATDRILAQQLDFAQTARNDLGWIGKDPWLESLGSAAARGVSVQVLAATPFSSTDAGNRPELEWLAQRGAQTAELDRDGLATLHNKAFVIDDRVVVLGSMNGNHHSRSANREATLIIHSTQAAVWAAGLFVEDWDPPAPRRDWSAPEQDLRSLPLAPWPTLLALIGVALALRGRR